MSTYAVYGFGSMGKRRVRLLLDTPETEHVLVYDPVIPANEILEALPEADRLRVWPLEDETKAPPIIVNAAFVCTPPVLHLRQASLLLSQGIPTLVEKPFCLLDELPAAKRLYDWAWDSGIPAWPGHNLRHHPFAVRIQEWLRAGEIGTLQFHTARFGQHLKIGRPWAETPTYIVEPHLGGGAMQECLQDIDLYIQWVTAANARGVYAWGEIASDIEQSGPIGVLHVPPHQGVRSVMVFDQLRHAKLRQHELIGSEGTIVWRQEVSVLGDELERLLISTAQKDYHWASTFGGPELMWRSFQDETKSFLQHAAEPDLLLNRAAVSPFPAMDLISSSWGRKP